MDTCKDCLSLSNGHCLQLDDERHPDSPACELFVPGPTYEAVAKALGWKIVEKSEETRT